MVVLARRKRWYIVLVAVIAVGLIVGLVLAVPDLLNPRPAAPSPLSARFIFDPYPPDAGQTISFVGTASGGTAPYSYSWTFGDGSSRTGSTVTHAYSSAGTFTVVLTVNDSGPQRQSATSRQDVMVITSPPPPSSTPEIKISYSSSYNNTLEPSGFPPASSSTTYLVVHLTVENIGYQNFSANPFADMYVLIGANSYNVSGAYLFLRYPFPATNMTNAQTASGDVVFEVPQGSTSFDPSWRLGANPQITVDWVKA
jgi:PKD repeat protein